MVAFLYLYEDLCADLEATWAIGFAESIDDIAPGAAALWQMLETTGKTLGSTSSTGETDWGAEREPPADTAWGDG
jgi:hypothetical protein